jgi:hypothetical protein
MMMPQKLFQKLFQKLLHRQGQSLIEFALILPILLMALMIVIEIARLFPAWLTIESSARQAAHYALSGTYDPQKCRDYGLACDSTDQAARETARNLARLYSIQDAARSALAGILADTTAGRDTRSFIDLVVCSTRRGADGQPKYVYLENPKPPSTTVYPRCVLSSDGVTEQQDPGGPGDRVTIAVLFDHPVITPLRAVIDWIPLLARRETIVNTASQ